MRMTGKFVLLLAVMLALFLGQAQAQRCLPGMKGVQLMADMVDGFYCGKERNDTGFAFGLSVSTYARGGNKWVSGIEIMRRYYPYRNTRIPWSSILRKAATITISFPTRGKMYF